jgi:hypothetical protein
MVREVLPVVRRAAVLAGVCATDPFRDIPLFLRELRDMGVVGIQVRVPLARSPVHALTPCTQNFPTWALYTPHGAVLIVRTAWA